MNDYSPIPLSVSEFKTLDGQNKFEITASLTMYGQTVNMRLDTELNKSSNEFTATMSYVGEPGSAELECASSKTIVCEGPGVRLKIDGRTKGVWEMAPKQAINSPSDIPYDVNSFEEGPCLNCYDISATYRSQGLSLSVDIDTQKGKNRDHQVGTLKYKDSPETAPLACQSIL